MAAAAMAFYRILVDWPSRYFYLNGHWRGLDSSSVCASLTNYDAAFWQHNEQACSEIINRQVHAVSVTVMTIVYFVLLTYATLGLLQCGLQSCSRFALASLHRLRKSEQPTDSELN